MPYAWVIASCSTGCLLSDCSLDLVFPSSLAVLADSPWLGSLLKPVGLPLYLVEFPPIELWDSLSSLVNSGIACLASQGSDWLDALWASLSSV